MITNVWLQGELGKIICKNQHTFSSVKARDDTHLNDQYSIRTSLRTQKNSPLYLVNQKPILAILTMEVEYR